MKKRTHAAAATLCAASMVAVGVYGAGAASASARNSASGPVLTAEGSPSGPLTKNFNPFTPDSADSVLGFNDLIYEPLFQADLLKPGTYYPWLATKYAWSNGGKTITFTVRSGVKFSNGQAMSASDVAFTFNLMKKYPGINTQGLPLAGASAPNATTAVVNLTAPSYSLLYNIANTAVLPESGWSGVNPVTYADPTPVGTGPYVVSTFSPEGVTLTANPTYWGSTPKVKEVEFPVYDSNTSANLALEDGSLDWGGNFVSDISKAYLAKSKYYHYWDFGLQTETIIPNLDEFPFNSLPVREAVSDAIDRTVISNEGEDYQQPPAVGPGSLTALTLPLDKSYVTPSISKYVTTYNTAEAKSVLEKAGWKMGSNGYFQKGGKTLSFSFVEPAAYTDFITDDDIMIAELKKAGIDASLSPTSVDAWDADLADGHFQATSHWGTGGPSPYYDYNAYLNSATTAPIGKTATNDFERYDNPTVDKLLSAYAATDNPATEKADIAAIGKIVATQLPVIPIFYGVAWFEYSSKCFSGWPSASNPYAPGEPDNPFDEVVLLHLTPTCS